MVCYAVPLALTFLLHGGRKWTRMEERRRERLEKLMAGGAIFGVVDHAWNGELLLVGKDPLADVMLGVTITLALLAFWGFSEYAASHQAHGART